jgi:hypothetical protein
MKTRETYYLAALAVLCLLLSGTAGCQIGPGALKVGHAQYADAARRIADEQMLLNLVRLRYRETPVWLEVTSISTQFEFDSSGEVGGTLNENVGQGGALNPNSLGLAGRVGYSERPTITYTILGGEDFLKTLLKPLDVVTISMLAESGWRGDRVFRLTVERINGLRNAPRASGPTPTDAPRYKPFLEAVHLIHDLAKQYLIEFEFDTRVKYIGDPLASENVEGDMAVDAAKIGAEFKSVDDGTKMALTQERRVLIMRFAERAEESPEATRLRELLALDAAGIRFDFVDPVDGDYDPIEPRANLTNISVDTRSLIGVMYYLSNAVEVPAEDMISGPATATFDEAGAPFDWQNLLGDIFVVHCSKNRPNRAAVAVPFRGNWFYLAHDDESTLSTFALLNQLVSLQSGGQKGVAPVLTIPVGG